MSNYNSLKTTIDANIKQNGNQEITGKILNSVLNQMVTTLGAGYQFAGVATIATNPGTPDAKVFYIANGKGTYEKFGGINVTEDDVVVLYWDSSWHKVSTGIASDQKLSELEGKVNGKQDALTLTVKDNGNIVIGNIQGQTKEFMPATPSGDPMHYAYVAAGAEYNENTGFWKIGSVDDITNNEIRKAYNIRPAFVDSSFNGVYSHIASRVIFPLRIYGGGNTFSNKGVLFYDAGNLIEIPETVNKKDFYFSGSANFLFANDRKLKYIRMTMFFEKVTDNQNSFAGCISLEEVLINTNSSLYFNDCSKLSIESVLYMINNESATSPITITLHADAYARAMANADIIAALEAHPNVSLASA